MVEVMPRVADDMMTIEEFWKLAEKEIWPKSQKRSLARMVCRQCNRDAKGYKDPRNRTDHNGRAPLLPADFNVVCPEYKGRCPRCGGGLHDSYSF